MFTVWDWVWWRSGSSGSGWAPEPRVLGESHSSPGGSGGRLALAVTKPPGSFRAWGLFLQANKNIFLGARRGLTFLRGGRKLWILDESYMSNMYLYDVKVCTIIYKARDLKASLYHFLVPPFLQISSTRRGPDLVIPWVDRDSPGIPWLTLATRWSPSRLPAWGLFWGLTKINISGAGRLGPCSEFWEKSQYLGTSISVIWGTGISLKSGYLSHSIQYIWGLAALAALAGPANCGNSPNVPVLPC